MGNGKVSIVIPYFRGGALLNTQLESVAADVGPLDEVVIADNEGAGVPRAIDRRRLPITVVDASQRSGNAAARNIGAASAIGDTLLFLDQDDAVVPGWRVRMLEGISRADVVAGANLLCTDFPTPDDSTPSNTSRFPFLPFGLSCNMGVRRSAFELLGGFDEGYRSATDLDLCFRSQLAGMSFEVLPEAVVLKRRKSRGAFRQHREFGIDDVQLYRRFRDVGMDRGLGMRRWLWLMLRSPQLRDERRRIEWIRVAARSVGRIEGSVRHRVFCP